MMGGMQLQATTGFVPTASHRLWRGLPSTLRRRLLAQATGWAAPKPSRRTGPAAAGIAVAGEFSRASGFGEGARLMAEAARRLDIPVWTIDLPPPVDGRREVEVTVSELPPPHVPLVLHVNAPSPAASA
jgi:hypothetical protein